MIQNRDIKNYWLNHSVGRMCPEAYQSAIQSYAQAWQQPEPWPTWLAQLGEFREECAALLNTHPRNICPQANVSSALTKVLQSLVKENKKIRILLSEQDFPTISFVVKQLPDAQLSYLSAEKDHTDLDVWQEALSQGVDLVIMTHVYSNSAQQAPVGDIIEACQKQGIFTIVDVAQSVGVIPIDLAQWQPDVVLGTSVKWLCGGSGAAFMYLNDESIKRLEPNDVGWFSHINPFEFDPHHFEYAMDATRFLGGTPSVLPYVVASHAIAKARAYGIEQIRAHNLCLANKVIDAVDPSWVVSPREETRRGGTVVIRAPKGEQEALIKRLGQGGVFFDERATGIRLSGHITTTEEEADYLAALLNGELCASVR